MADKIDRAALPQRWVHSHEEDTADEMVFRPASHAFPPSRGRRSFQLNPQGTAVTFGPAPDDRSVQSEGTWRLDADNKLILQTGTVERTMPLIRVEPNKLVVKKE
jgi:hypothetical protein